MADILAGVATDDARPASVGRRVPAGSATLDHALGGGFPGGSLVVLCGEAGAGSTELAFGQALAHVRAGAGSCAFASLLRSPRRVAAEARALLNDPLTAEIRCIDLRDDAIALLRAAAAGMTKGGVLVVESASALARRAGGESGFLGILETLAEAAAAAEGAVVLLHTPGALTPAEESRLEETADVVLRLQWRDGGTFRRRTLRVVKVRGLAPCLEGEEVRVFEIAVHPGSGVSLSHIRNVA